jgi:heat shock protein HslJ
MIVQDASLRYEGKLMVRTFFAVLIAACSAAACGSTTSDGTTPVTLAPSPTVPLIGTQWTAVEIDGAPTGNARSTLLFDSETHAAGSTGCNRYFATVSIDAAALSFRGVGSTRMACEAPFMEQETRFVTALDAVRSHRIEGTTLLLVDQTGRTRLRLNRQ